jgi:hypothetical protein
MYCSVPSLGLGQMGALAAIGIGGLWLHDSLLSLLAISAFLGISYVYGLWKGSKELREEGWM